MVAGTWSSVDLDDGRALGGNASSGSDAVCDAGDGREHFFALLWIHGSNGELQASFVWNDVVLRAGMERADGDDSRKLRIHFAADNRLQHDDDFRGDDNRIFCRLRRGAVPAIAAHGDVNGIRTGKQRPRMPGNFSGGYRGRCHGARGRNPAWEIF